MKNKKLLFSITKKDFKIDTYRGSGKGGQKRNKTDSAVRITHLESGAIGMSEDERSQYQNKKMAFKRLVESDKFKKWHNTEVAKRLGRIIDVEKEVEKLMSPENIKVEGKDEDGRWVELYD